MEAAVYPPHPEAAMKMINYFASEEGQYLLMWGIEGTIRIV